MTPGTWPSWASLRKQILQIPNLRMYARGRPAEAAAVMLLHREASRPAGLGD